MSSLSVFNSTPNASSSSAVITATGKALCSPSISGYMQDFNPSTLCSNVTSGSLTDKRDNQVYTVAKINGNWWMTRNLAIGCNGSGNTYGSGRATRSLTSSDSNVSTTWSTGDAGALTSGDSYTAARMQCSSTYGAWYNYAAASAGTITGSSNSTEATYDICPKKWRLPTGSDDSEQFSVTSDATTFKPVAGGAYWSGSLTTGQGDWWSITTRSTVSRYVLDYRSNVLSVGRGSRVAGYYVRCIYST